MFILVKRGQARKLNNSRPVIYTLQPKDTGKAKPTKKAPAAAKNVKAPPSDIVSAEAAKKPAPQDSPKPPFQKTEEKPVPHPEPASKKEQVLSLEDLESMQIPLEVIGEAIFRRSREQQRKIYDLENELVETKRKLDDANKRIGELNRTIERQNQTIASQNRDQRFPQATARVKDVATIIDWKRKRRG